MPSPSHDNSVKHHVPARMQTTRRRDHPSETNLPSTMKITNAIDPAMPRCNDTELIPSAQSLSFTKQSAEFLKN